MVEENERMNKQLVNDLVKTVDAKNEFLVESMHQFVVMRNMVAEVDALRVRAEAEKREIEEQHKRGKLRSRNWSANPAFFNGKIFMTWPQTWFS